jgi:hypothetical protein
MLWQPSPEPTHSAWAEEPRHDRSPLQDLDRVAPRIRGTVTDALAMSAVEESVCGPTWGPRAPWDRE